MRTPKFNFIPERQLNKDTGDQTGFIVSLKKRVMSFKKADVDIYELDGKYVRMFADTEKKVIGWAIVEGKTGLDELNDARILNRNDKTGVLTISIGKLLKAVGIEGIEEIRRCPVKTYISPLQKDTIYYIELENRETNKTQ